MFEKSFGRYVCQDDFILCKVGNFECKATVYFDDDRTPPDERQDGFWPSQDKDDPGWVLPENYEAEMAKATKVMKAWKDDEWWYGGIAVTVYLAGVQLTGKYHHALWSVEVNYPDSDNSYLLEVANELLPEALEAAKLKVAELQALATES